MYRINVYVYASKYIDYIHLMKCIRINAYVHASKYIDYIHLMKCIRINVYMQVNTLTISI